MEHFKAKISHYVIEEGQDRKKSVEIIIAAENYTHAEEMAHKYSEERGFKTYTVEKITKANIAEVFPEKEDGFAEPGYFQGKIEFQHMRDNGSVKIEKQNYLVEVEGIHNALDFLTEIGEKYAPEEFTVVEVKETKILDYMKS